MKLKISNKTFYNRHNIELERFLIHTNCLHIINKKSENKITEEYSQKIYIDFDNEGIEKLKNLKGTYSSIILTDILEVSKDIYELFQILACLLDNNGKLIISSVNPKYNYLIKIFEFFNLKDKNKDLSYIHNKRIKNVASGSGFEFNKTFSRQIVPFKILLIGDLFNKIFEVIFFYLNLGVKTYSIFRLANKRTQSLTKSIIIPAKNEEGNLLSLINRIPRLERYEIIFSCGESEDKTFELANEIKSKEKYFDVSVIKQTGTGKANAVAESFDICKGDIIAILDADISVEPETLPDFFEIIEENNADFVNGTRLIYKMEKGSMRSINKIGNRIFQFFIGSIIKEKLTDSLCGTKVFKKELIPKINWWKSSFNVKDPFGDFDLIFTAAFTGEKIIEFPIHYKSRTYGKTQISRFKDGYKLVKYLLKTYIVFNVSR